MAKETKEVLTISKAEIDRVAEDICGNYCKYPETWDPEAEGMELFESDICANCPLTTLYDGGEREQMKPEELTEIEGQTTIFEFMAEKSENAPLAYGYRGCKGCHWYDMKEGRCHWAITRDRGSFKPNYYYPTCDGSEHFEPSSRSIPGIVNTPISSATRSSRNIKSLWSSAKLTIYAKPKPTPRKNRTYTAPTKRAA